MKKLAIKVPLILCLRLCVSKMCLLQDSLISIVTALLGYKQDQFGGAKKRK